MENQIKDNNLIMDVKSEQITFGDKIDLTELKEQINKNKVTAASDNDLQMALNAYVTKLLSENEFATTFGFFCHQCKHVPLVVDVDQSVQSYYFACDCTNFDVINEIKSRWISREQISKHWVFSPTALVDLKLSRCHMCTCDIEAYRTDTSSIALVCNCDMEMVHFRNDLTITWANEEQIRQDRFNEYQQQVLQENFEIYDELNEDDSDMSEIDQLLDSIELGQSFDADKFISEVDELVNANMINCDNGDNFLSVIPTQHYPESNAQEVDVSNNIAIPSAINHTTTNMEWGLVKDNSNSDIRESVVVRDVAEIKTMAIQEFSKVFNDLDRYNQNIKRFYETLSTVDVFSKYLLSVYNLTVVAKYLLQKSVERYAVCCSVNSIPLDKRIDTHTFGITFRYYLLLLIYKIKLHCLQYNDIDPSDYMYNDCVIFDGTDDGVDCYLPALFLRSHKLPEDSQFVALINEYAADQQTIVLDDINFYKFMFVSASVHPSCVNKGAMTNKFLRFDTSRSTILTLNEKEFFRSQYLRKRYGSVMKILALATKTIFNIFSYYNLSNAAYKYRFINFDAIYLIFLSGMILNAPREDKNGVPELTEPFLQKIFSTVFTNGYNDNSYLYAYDFANTSVVGNIHKGRTLLGKATSVTPKEGYIFSFLHMCYIKNQELQYETVSLDQILTSNGGKFIFHERQRCFMIVNEPKMSELVVIARGRKEQRVRNVTAQPIVRGYKGITTIAPIVPDVVIDGNANVFTDYSHQYRLDKAQYHYNLRCNIFPNSKPKHVNNRYSSRNNNIRRVISKNGQNTLSPMTIFSAARVRYSDSNWRVKKC